MQNAEIKVEKRQKRERTLLLSVSRALPYDVSAASRPNCVDSSAAAVLTNQNTAGAYVQMAASCCGATQHGEAAISHDLDAVQNADKNKKTRWGSRSRGQHRLCPLGVNSGGQSQVMA